MRRSLIDFFAGLSKSELKAVCAMATRVSLMAGEVLFHQGQIANALYLVTSGALGVFISQPNSERVLVALIGKGESVGEAGIISDETRSASIAALRDSELLRIDRKQFEKLIRKNPGISILMNKVLAERLKRATLAHTINIKPKVISFIATSPNIDVIAIAKRAADKIRQNFSQSVHVHETPEFNETTGSLNDLEEAHDLIILCCREASADWTQTCVRQSDRICLITDASSNLSPEISKQLMNIPHDHQMVDLFILHENPDSSPHQTQAFLDKIEVTRHFHIRTGLEADWDRLSRITTGRGIGIVLSGGGARAYAHLGVMRALQDAGIPVDFIAGTSMGGIIAASIAMGAGLDAVEEQIKRCFVSSNPLSDYTLPLQGLVQGRKVETLLEENFGVTEINDLWLPFFCISTNLTSATSHTHAKGKLSKALRASISLPGILPPVVTPEGVLVDGGVINNLPAIEMSHICHGPIIAVDVSRDLAVTPQTWSDQIKQPLWKRLLSPPLVTLLVRSGTVSGEREYRQQSEMAHVNLNPALGPTDILNWKAFDETVRLGYEYTVEQIKTNPCLSALRNREDNHSECGL